jgi:hypothetical protein
MHRINAGQTCRILTVQIAVPAEAEPGDIADQLSALLSEAGCCDAGTLILDWQYAREYGDNFEKAPLVTAREGIEEGEIFNQF